MINQFNLFSILMEYKLRIKNTRAQNNHISIKQCAFSKLLVKTSFKNRTMSENTHSKTYIYKHEKEEKS